MYWADSAPSRIHQQLETDGDALPSDVPMRISLVSPGFPPQLGGVEVVVGYLADELRGHGHQVTVYAQRPRGSSFPASHDYPVRRFADWSGSRQFPVAPGLVRALWRDRGLFDVIHAHSFHAVPAMMAATVPKVPLVFTPHFHAVGHTRAASALHTVYDPLATLLFRRADKVTCVSVAESELLLRRYPSVEPRLSIIPLGVDTEALLAAEPFETDRPIVLIAGRLEAYKRVDTAIRAFASMRKDAQLVVCGTGSHRPALERLARELGIASRVSFRGQVSDGELRRWQRTATSTLSLSAQGGFRAGAPGGGRGGQPGGGFRHPCPCRTGAPVGARGCAYGCRDAGCGRRRSRAGQSGRDGTPDHAAGSRLWLVHDGSAVRGDLPVCELMSCG